MPKAAYWHAKGILLRFKRLPFAMPSSRHYGYSRYRIVSRLSLYIMCIVCTYGENVLTLHAK